MTWATSVSILVFLCLSVLDLGPMYATDRQTDVRRASSLNAPYHRGGIINSATELSAATVYLRRHDFSCSPTIPQIAEITSV